jgi:uncharacterized protein (DUF1778 family)
MAKDARLSFRVQSDFKKGLEAVAAREGRSLAQVCEAFLQAAMKTYQKEGSKFLQRFVSRQKSKDAPL